MVVVSTHPIGNSKALIEAIVGKTTCHGVSSRVWTPRVPKKCVVKQDPELELELELELESELEWELESNSKSELDVDKSLLMA